MEQQENSSPQQFSQEEDDATISAQLESTRFDSFATHVQGVNVRTEKDITPQILKSRDRGLLTSLIERGKRIVTLYQKIEELKGQEEILTDDLKAFAADRSDFRGFEYIGEEQTVVSIFPVYRFDADKLQASIGSENFIAATHNDTLTFRVMLDGHPEARSILEDAFRRSVRATLRLKEDDEVNARVQVTRSATIRRSQLKELLKNTGKHLLAGTVKKPQWHLVVRPFHKEEN